MNYPIFIQPADVRFDWMMDDIGPAPDKAILMREMEDLLAGPVMLRTAPYVLLVCGVASRPALRQELGRLREITFRQVGESTGKPYDTDAYDDYYEQLIIWDEQAGQLVGGYRFGCGDKIFARCGRAGFYIQQFFEIDPVFDTYLPRCLELGRSFVVPEYQKRNLPLYLLWKGILAYTFRHPQYQYLIGPVSISRYYSDFARKVMMEYARRHYMHPDFAAWFRPRLPYNPIVSLAEQQELRAYAGSPPTFEEILDRIQPEHIRFPVLMMQYLRQNARFLGFNLDPNFNDALDGLMILDMADVPDNTIGMLSREMP